MGLTQVFCGVRFHLYVCSKLLFGMCLIIPERSQKGHGYFANIFSEEIVSWEIFEGEMSGRNQSSILSRLFGNVFFISNVLAKVSYHADEICQGPFKHELVK